MNDPIDSQPGGTAAAPPRVLVVDDEAGFRDLYGQVLEEAGFQTLGAASAEEAYQRLATASPDMVVSDVRMPGDDGLTLLRRARATYPALPFLLVTAYSEVRDAVRALRLGAVDYLAKPVDLDALVESVAATLGIARRTPGRADLPATALEGIVAESPALLRLLADADRVAKSDATVLLTGETGAGKEVVAGFIHRRSPRGGRPLVSINCAAVPGELLATELFGHQRGAFTGASSTRKGRFREADGGTLFLDEIGELPLELQPVLLRALETRRVTPLGTDREVQVDVRIVAASNRDLGAEVAAGRFRADLYYRLNVIAFEVPPLRQRPEDVLPLARFFLRREGDADRRLAPATARALRRHPWPGNVRELANAIDRARLLARSEIILPDHLPRAVRAAAAAAAAPSGGVVEPRPAVPEEAAPAAEALSLEEIERNAVRRALELAGGNRTVAAERLGISRRGLLNKIKRYGL